MAAYNHFAMLSLKSTPELMRIAAQVIWAERTEGYSRSDEYLAALETLLEQRARNLETP